MLWLVGKTNTIALKVFSFLFLPEHDAIWDIPWANWGRLSQGKKFLTFCVSAVQQ